MKYIVAYDGGGTKTHIAVFDKIGNIKYEHIGEGSNYMANGRDKFISVIRKMYLDALSKLGISISDIEFVFLGLSGADLESDYLRLTELCKEVFNDTPFKVVNDAWIVLRSGLKEQFGAVAIAGTGTNSAAVSKTGKKAILRALSFTTGTYGGGLDIAREALHYAYKSEELTYKKTVLEEKIPVLFGKSSMVELIDMFYPVNIVPKKEFGEITALVNDCAVMGDEVSKEILYRIGKSIGEQTLGVIKQVGIENEEVPVVIGGRVFTSKSPVLLDSFKKYLLKGCINARIIKPLYPPVYGAYLFALDELGIEQSDEIISNLKRSEEL